MQSSRDEFQVFMRQRLFVVRWRNPTAEAGRALTPLIEGQHRSVGEPLFFAILIGPDCPPPSSEAREVMLHEYDRIHPLTTAVHTVIIAGSARQTVMRSVMTAMTLGAGLRGKPFKVDGTVAHMARAACKVLGGQPELLLRELVAAGLVSAAESSL